MAGVFDVALDRARSDVHVLPIGSDADVIVARQEGRMLAELAGFGRTETTLIATAISELARNIILYAGSGVITLGCIEDGSRVGFEILASDDGPGIANVEAAMGSGFSTSGGLGLGLPGVRRVVDEFAIDSRPGAGTRVRALRWRRRS